MTPPAWIVMTALPPTTGHEDLIAFASKLAPVVNVVLCTQPSEPLVVERLAALVALTERPAFSGVRVHHIHEELPQEPAESPDFWDMWRAILHRLGAKANDLIVASEPYGAELAAAIGGTYVPYDLGRFANPAKATRLREDPIGAFSNLLAEFQPFLRKRVTLFGAESVGKTTVTRRLAELGVALGQPEWARAYLEHPAVGAEVTPQKMRAIWQGQLAQQLAADPIATRMGCPFIAQDTDLYSTIGYWLLKGEEFGEPQVPTQLWQDAASNASDLYIVLGQEAVPFEVDPLRYGGIARESTDTFWTDLCDRAGLNWVFIDDATSDARVARAIEGLHSVFGTPLAYRRRGAEYSRSVSAP